MKKRLENLWNEYLLDKCAAIDTYEEKALTKKAAELHEKANSLLDKEQKDAVDKYIDELSNIEALFAKKAFLKGCEFAVSFIFETVSFEK